MVTITDTDGLDAFNDNNTFVGTPPAMTSSKIIVRGKGNILYVEPNVSLQSCSLEFNGNNSLIMLGSSKHVYRVSLSVNNNCTCVIGRDNYFNGMLKAVVSEERMVLIGDSCLFSFGVWIRTADPHLIYDSETLTRINPSKNVIVGDHVWIGQDALILKGTAIGSGSIIGGLGVVAGKKVPSNTSWAGNPVKCVREKLFWDNPCVHSWTARMTEKSQKFKGNPYTYESDENTVSYSDLTQIIDSLDTADKRLEFFKKFGYGNGSHNRLAISTKAQTSTKPQSSSGNANKRFKLPWRNDR